MIQYFTEFSHDETSGIIVSHVRKGSLAYRTGVLHIGDKLLALNGNKMNCVEDAITFIDAIPLGEIVSVTVQKEQEVEGKQFIQHANRFYKLGHGQSLLPAAIFQGRVTRDLFYLTSDCHAPPPPAGLLTSLNLYPLTTA